MISFHPVTPADRSTITAFTLPSGRRNCDLSFSNLCSWRFLYGTGFAVYRDFLLLRFTAGGRTLYMLPVGGDDLADAIRAIADDARAMGTGLTMAGVCADMVEEIGRLMPGRFDFHAERDFADYVYRRADLASLSGRHLQPKRNHVNRFRHRYPDYEYVALTADHIDECLALEAQWYDAHPAHRHRGTDNERRALTYALTHYDALGLTGGIVRVDGRAVAFTFGTAINHDTFGVHVEKADVGIDGAFAIINQEFAAHLPEQYVYLNREEDLGIDGLRRAKLSYHPAIILDKYIAIAYDRH